MTRAEITVAPETRGFEPRLETRGELVRRQPHDVLLVEPVELFGVEHGVAAADPLERERRDELVAREQLAIAAAGRPAEQRRKFTIASGR